MTTTKTPEKADALAPALAPEDLSAALAPAGDAIATIAGLAATTLAATADAGDSDAVRAAEANIADDLERGGPAFGSFLRSVGLAVADGQAAMDKTLVATSTALAGAQVEVVALFTQELKEDGTMETATPLTMKLPLIQFLHPTAYQFTQVHLTADMEVSEFNTANGLNIKKKSTDFNVNAKLDYSLLGGFSGGGGFNLDIKSSEDSERKSSSERKAAGRLHMEATIEPRPDFALPQPFLVQKGPKLRLVIGDRRELDAAGQPTTDPKLVVRREVDVTATLTAKAGGPAAGKALEAQCDSASVSLNIPNGGVTSSTGELKITLVRSGMTADTSTPAIANLRVSMNLVNATVPVSI